MNNDKTLKQILKGVENNYALCKNVPTKIKICSKWLKIFSTWDSLLCSVKCCLAAKHVSFSLLWWLGVGDKTVIYKPLLARAHLLKYLFRLFKKSLILLVYRTFTLSFGSKRDKQHVKLEVQKLWQPFKNYIITTISDINDMKWLAL